MTGLAQPPPEGADRVLRLVGADNVRDLGGLPTADGRQTRRGRLFRGELMLIEADVELLIARVGLRSVVDLRTRGEVRHNLARWLDHEVDWIHCPFSLGRLAPVPGPGADYVAAYMGFLEAGPEPVLLAARTLISASSQPALFHCAAGKDRTGVLCALLLDVLGVLRRAIAEDYAMTSERLPQVLRRLGELQPYSRTLEGSVAADHEVRAETMLAFLDELDKRHGGPESWFLAQGLSPDALVAYRDSMLCELPEAI